MGDTRVAGMGEQCVCVSRRTKATMCALRCRWKWQSDNQSRMKRLPITNPSNITAVHVERARARMQHARQHSLALTVTQHIHTTHKNNNTNTPEPRPGSLYMGLTWQPAELEGLKVTFQPGIGLQVPETGRMPVSVIYTCRQQYTSSKDKT